MIKEWLLIIKYWIKNPIDRFKTRHTICCPNCFSNYYIIRKYKPGQTTLCKNCKEKIIKEYYENLIYMKKRK